MKKIILSIFATVSVLMATPSETAYYDIDFSVVGTIAKASVERTQSDTDYIITLNAKAVGIAAELSKDKNEMYISQGSVVDGELIPDVLMIRRADNKQEKFTVFRFDHANKCIKVDSAETKEVSETSLDVATLSIIKTTKEVYSSSTHDNDYYAQNDIVSLFFNGKHYTKHMKDGEQKALYAVGIKTDEGELMINLPSESTVMKTAAFERDTFGIAVSKDIFEDDNGQLIVKLDADNFPASAVMNNVALYGDVTSTRVYKGLATK